MGVPLTSKRLTISHYLPLIDKIVARTRHWTARLLSYAGRIQLVKSITLAIAQYWMMCFPLPKFVLKKIDAICRSFIWTGSHEIKKKSLVAWKNICKPKCHGGLDIINFSLWNVTTMVKCLWNLCRKADNLWVKWIHMFYIKGRDILQLDSKTTWSWIFKNIMTQRELIELNHQDWAKLMQQDKFSMTTIYRLLLKEEIYVPWRFLMHNNHARPRAKLTL